MGDRKPELAETVVVSQDWLNRRKDALTGSLQTYKGTNVFDLRKYAMTREGKLVPTAKGRLMSEAFAPAIELPSDYASMLVMRWELDDPRDAWKWTGELPPKPEPYEWPARRPYSTPQSTIDAFHFVLRSGDQERISAWIRNHPDDAPTLIKLVEAA